jgi:hypothetical protein
MNKNKAKLTAVAVVTVGLAAVGIGNAVASQPQAKPQAPAVTAPAKAAVAPAVAPAARPAVTTADADTLQQGDQTTPDAPGTAESTTEAPGAPETAEAPGAPETGPSDGNDGGHADPEGANVDHVGGPNEK